MWTEIRAALYMTYRITPRWLCGVILGWMLIVTAGCAVIFRWTSTPADKTEYSRPLRTRGGIR